MFLSELVEKWRKKGVVIGDGFVFSIERQLSVEEKDELDRDIKSLDDKVF